MPIKTEPMTVNVGPQHPSTHGVLRLRITFDGEEIVEVEPVFGYLHRGTEKLAEERNYVQIVTLTDRLDYVSSMINNQAYCLAVEKLLGVEPPPLVHFEAAALSTMARSFYRDNKRVSNRRIKEELGVALAYPDYRASLAAILAAGG